MSRGNQVPSPSRTYSGGSGGTAAAQPAGTNNPPKPRAKRSGFHRQPGARTMKEYPLTGPEMWSLAGVGLAATVFFGAGSFFLSTWFDIYKDLAVPPSEMTHEMKGYWTGLKQAAGWACVVSFVVGAVLTAVSSLTIWNIVKNTEHPL